MNTSLTAGELKALLERGVTLVDVREPVEYAEERVAGARLIPLGQLAARVGEIGRSEPVVVMCRSGKRGEQALAKLGELGLVGVRNLAGGLLGWKAAGFAVERVKRRGFPLMQQVQMAIGAGVLAGVVLARAVHPDFIYVSAFFGAGLLFAGCSGWCGLAILLSKMPWNRVEGAAGGSPRTCSTGG